MTPRSARSPAAVSTFKGMRRTPNAGIAIGIFIAYVAVVSLVWVVFGVDYDTISASTSSVLQAVVYPVGLGAVVLAIAATWLGWWRASLFEDPQLRLRSKWGWAATIILAAAVAISFVSVDYTVLGGSFIAALAIGTLLVGFSEELLTRGLGIVGARGSMAEQWVMVFSATLFALLHVPNAIFGQAIEPTVQQVVTAFVVGVVFYVVRRATGTILVTMVLHAGWDFTTLGGEHAGATPLFVPMLLPFAVIASVIALAGWLRSAPATRPGPAA